MAASTTVQEPGGLATRPGLWQRLTEPSPDIQDIQQRRNARLTASLLVVLVPLVSIILAAAQFAAMVGLPLDQYLRLTVLRWTLVVVLIGAYFLAKSRRHALGSLLVVLIVWFLVYSTQYLIPNNPVGWSGQIVTLIVPIMLCGMVFSVTRTALVSSLILLLELPIPFLVPSESHTIATLVISILVLAIAASIRLVAMRHRDGIERDRNAQLVTANSMLEAALKEASEARKVAVDANRLKSEFLATMSHELRTPLHAIIGFADVQLEGMTGELTDEQQRYLERILLNADHLLALINDVLDLAKIEAGRMEIAKKPVDTRAWLTEICDLTSMLAEKKGLQFESDLDEHMPPQVVADPERLKQVVLNLLSNAVKFTEKGRVRIDVERHSQTTWRITVTDSGIGIPAHAMEYIFDEFRQVDGSSRRAHGGTGLGLAIVRKLVLTMGGTIRVESEVGKGSAFTIILPLDVPAQTPAPALAAPVAAG